MTPSPGQRFRLEQCKWPLAEDSVNIKYAPLECRDLKENLYKSGNTAKKIRLILEAWGRRRAELLRSVREYDAVYIFREAALLGPPVLEQHMPTSGVPIVFDFDDAVFVPYKSPSNGYLSLLKFPSKTGSTCRSPLT